MIRLKLLQKVPCGENISVVNWLRKNFKVVAVGLVSLLIEMIEKAEKKYGTEGYSFDPGFATYSCSCTAHKKSCGWD